MPENTTGPTLYHRWSSVEGQMLRMVLGAKGLHWNDHPCALRDQESAFDLGFAELPVLVHADGQAQQGNSLNWPPWMHAIQIPRRCTAVFQQPNGRLLYSGVRD